WLLRTPGLIYVAVWTVNMLVWACLGALGAFMYLWANDWKNDVPRTHSDREVWVAKGLGIFFLVMCALWLCTLVFLRKRINLAVGLVREAARAVIDMPLIVLYPFLQAAGLVLFLVPWSFYSV
ncbi:choline transporter-like protein 1-like protein, partial [Nannochloropsis gaditana CCMP526]